MPSLCLCIIRLKLWLVTTRAKAVVEGDRVENLAGALCTLTKCVLNVRTCIHVCLYTYILTRSEDPQTRRCLTYILFSAVLPL